MRSVTIASADNSVSGSKCATNCTERLSASMCGFARRHAVGQKDHVELGALGGLRDLDVVARC